MVMRARRIGAAMASEHGVANTVAHVESWVGPRAAGAGRGPPLR
jgi:hypothetical protein